MSGTQAAVTEPGPDCQCEGRRLTEARAAPPAGPGPLALLVAGGGIMSHQCREGTGRAWEGRVEMAREGTPWHCGQINLNARAGPGAGRLFTSRDWTRDEILSARRTQSLPEAPSPLGTFGINHSQAGHGFPARAAA